MIPLRLAQFGERDSVVVQFQKKTMIFQGCVWCAFRVFSAHIFNRGQVEQGLVPDIPTSVIVLLFGL